MAMSKKDKTQLVIIGTIIVVVLIGLIVNYRSKFLPEPVSGGEDFSILDRIGTPVDIDTEFFNRPDFSGLRHYGEINIIPPDISGIDEVVSDMDNKTIDVEDMVPINNNDAVEDTP